MRTKSKRRDEEDDGSKDYYSSGSKYKSRTKFGKNTITLDPCDAPYIMDALNRLVQDPKCVGECRTRAKIVHTKYIAAMDWCHENKGSQARMNEVEKEAEKLVTQKCDCRCQPGHPCHEHWVSYVMGGGYGTSGLNRRKGRK